MSRPLPSRARLGDGCARSTTPFLNVDFLRILEAHGAGGRPCGWLARHLAATDEDGTVRGLLPLYARFNSHGDFIHDWSWAAAYQQLGRAYYPKLLSGLPHTPATGPRLLVAAAAVEPQAHAERQRLLQLAGEAGEATGGDRHLPASLLEGIDHEWQARHPGHVGRHLVE